MSGSARWKEDRIRQEIYLTYLKHTNTVSSGAGHSGANLRGWNGGSAPFLEKTSATRSEKWIPNRKKTNRLPSKLPREQNAYLLTGRGRKKQFFLRWILRSEKPVKRFGSPGCYRPTRGYYEGVFAIWNAERPDIGQCSSVFQMRPHDSITVVSKLSV